jgi:hypothetical protein
VRYALRGPTSRPAVAAPRHCSEEREEEMTLGGRKEAATVTRTEQRSTTSPSPLNRCRPLDLRRPSSREQGKGHGLGAPPRLRPARAWSSTAGADGGASSPWRPLLVGVRALLLAGRERKGEAARRARGGADELLSRGRSIRARKNRYGPRRRAPPWGRAIRRGDEILAVEMSRTAPSPGRSGHGSGGYGVAWRK